jgi:hypothetical protein
MVSHSLRCAHCVMCPGRKAANPVTVPGRSFQLKRRKHPTSPLSEQFLFSSPHSIKFITNLSQQWLRRRSIAGVAGTSLSARNEPTRPRALSRTYEVGADQPHVDRLEALHELRAIEQPHAMSVKDPARQPPRVHTLPTRGPPSPPRTCLKRPKKSIRMSKC